MADLSLRTEEDDMSDMDSDLEELQGDIEKFDESVRDFLSTHHGNNDQYKPTRGGRGRGSRGPRRAAKPRGDITARLAKVNQAFLCGDYDQALDLASEVIRINAETYQAWTALSSIFREQGHTDRALSAMVYAAHLRPKDVSGWLSCASYALQTTSENGEVNLKTARLCYSAALKADFNNIEARLGKAAICHKQGHFSQAIVEYAIALRTRPADLEIVRKIAETCADNQYNTTSVQSAISAYQRFFALAKGASGAYSLADIWHDVGIYAELISATGRYSEAIHELRDLSRWIIGRSNESYWNQYTQDDREWDIDNARRSTTSEFDSSRFPNSTYGESLPLDLRARLVIYRLKDDNIEEAMIHLKLLNPDLPLTKAFAEENSFLAYELAKELLAHGKPELAFGIFDMLHMGSDEPDAIVLLQLGRCHLAMGHESKAEELFLAAIDADEDIIDARIELANLYEKAKEGEEALILAAEAMAIQDARDLTELNGQEWQDPSGVPRMHDTSRRISQSSKGTKVASTGRNSVIPKRYRPKRLAGPDKHRQEEETRALNLSHQYTRVKGLKALISDGRTELISEWMDASKDLVDDFRSLKRFYSWDKYLRFLGSGSSENQHRTHQQETELGRMYARLTQNVRPQTEDVYPDALPLLTAHEGIPFDDWLKIFLDYAIGLAAEHQRQRAYQVCESARDSIVFQSAEHQLAIYVTWAVCAVYCNDEETCVATARQLMRDGSMSDSYRMFGLLCKLCQSPVSWYTSGPAQKYILRQIKAIDTMHLTATSASSVEKPQAYPSPNTSSDAALDVSLLMLYGHILFTSTSYTYAIGYFLRAYAVDPRNSMINLSLGLAYIHYGLKRQSTNRQHLLLQGQFFMSNYLNQEHESNGRPLAERYYNVGRAFHLLGLGHLSSEFYTRAMDASLKGEAKQDIEVMVSVNTVISMLLSGNKEQAFRLMNERLVL